MPAKSYIKKAVILCSVLVLSAGAAFLFLPGIIPPFDLHDAMPPPAEVVKAQDIEHDLAMGDKYRLGQGVPADDAQAFPWYQKAADLGSSIGQYVLGMDYLFGDGGVSKDEKKAFEYFSKAAAQNHSTAKANLAVLYQAGVPGVLQADPAKGFDYAKQSASRGDPYGLYLVGFYNVTGEGTPESA